MKKLLILLAISIGVVSITSLSNERKHTTELMCPQTIDVQSVAPNAYQNIGQNDQEFVVHCDRCELGVFVHRDEDNKDHCTYCDWIKGNMEK